MTKKRTITHTERYLNRIDGLEDQLKASRTANKLLMQDIVKAEKERDAYREICVQIQELHFKKQDTETLEGLPSSLTIPRKEWAYKFIDALAQRLLSDKRNTFSELKDG